MKKLELIPLNFPCRLGECPPGFFLFRDEVCFKSEYTESYNSAGEYFWGGTSDKNETWALIVQPLDYKWIIE